VVEKHSRKKPRLSVQPKADRFTKSKADGGSAGQENAETKGAVDSDTALRAKAAETDRFWS